MMMIFYPIYFGLIFISNYQTINALSCKDEKGNRVDYYVVYKPPKEKLERGYYHISKRMPSYMPEPQTPESPKPPGGWFTGGGYGSSESTDSKDSISSPTRSTLTKEMILSNLDIGDPKSFVGTTFADVYEKPDKFNYIMFSDKKPIGSESSSLNSKGRKLFGRYANYAKSKGVLAWSTDAADPRNNRAILFLHSVPYWLPKFSGKKYGWPESSRISIKRLFSKGPKLSFLDSLNNAHMAVCINLKFEDIKDVIKLLIISDLQVYEKKIISGDQLARAQSEVHSSSTGQQNGLFSRFTKMLKRKTYADSDLIKNSQTPGGTQFTIYTKPKSRIGDIFKMASRDKDINFDVLSRSYVPKPSSFRNLSHRLKPKCKIRFSKILAVEIGNLRWASREDESSWAASATNDKDFFCFSTLPQTIIGFKESGSMICIDDFDLTKAFYEAGKELDCKY